MDNIVNFKVTSVEHLPNLYYVSDLYNQRPDVERSLLRSLDY